MFLFLFLTGTLQAQEEFEDDVRYKKRVKKYISRCIIGKTKSTASQNEKYKKCRLISVYVKLKRHSFLV